MMETPAIKIFDLAKEIVDILSNMSKDELMELKLQYDIVFKQLDLVNLRKKMKGNNEVSNEENRKKY